MIKIHFWRKPEKAYQGPPWAEFHTDLGFGEAWPIHPADVEQRILSFVLDQSHKDAVEFHACSWLTIDIVGRLIKDKIIPLPVRVVYWDGEHEPKEIRIDVEGDFVECWPEDGDSFPSYFDAGFMYRYKQTPPSPSARQWYADELAKRDKITKLADFVENLMEEKN